MAIRMGYWDCPSCGAKRIPGPERQCSACGQPRGTEVRFYTDAAAPEVDDAAMLARARAGADWQCPYCSADNVAGATSCVGCGASTDEAKRREVRTIPDEPPAPVPARGVPTRGLGKMLAVVAAVLALAGWFLFLRTTEHTVEVTQKTWTKTVEIERLETTVGQGWDDEVPGGARLVDSTTRPRRVQVQDGYDRVKVGQRDLGNGFFEDVYEDRPRYVEREVNGRWIVYELDRWITERRLEESRTDGTEPPWPRFSGGPRQREGARRSEIAMRLRDDAGKEYAYAVEPSAGAGFEVGRSYVAEINAMGQIRALR